jgi:hypothetical protein
MVSKRFVATVAARTLTQQFSKQPAHNAASHAAYALRYVAVAMQGARQALCPVRAAPQQRGGEGHRPWMDAVMRHRDTCLPGAAAAAADMGRKQPADLRTGRRNSVRREDPRRGRRLALWCVPNLLALGRLPERAARSPSPRPAS